MKKSHQTDLYKAEALLEEAKTLITGVQESLQDDFDTKSERWQEGEKGEEAQQLIDDLSSIADEVETAFDNLINITCEF